MDPVVNLTPSCGLRGKVTRLDVKPTVEDRTVRDVNAFLGVPFAKPPVDDLRFREPQPLTLWSGVREAKKYGPICPQDFAILDLYPFPVYRPKLVDEDCLYLNIWTPTLDPNARLPVMFWIYGGAFTTGFSNLYDGETLANYHDVVFVSINYRVGVYGFFCLDDPEAPGNYGMLDQIEALKFVRQHIAAFGGDPDNITIFGESAGAMAVSLLVLSPLARGLFRRAICESGTSLSPGMVLPPPVAAKIIRKELDKINIPGCPPPSSSTSSEIIAFLRHQPAEALVPLGEKCRPVIAKPLLPAPMLSLYAVNQQTPCDFMIGCSSDEGYFLFNFLTSSYGLSPESLDRNVTRMIVRSICVMLGGEGATDRVTDEAMAEYFGTETKSADELYRTTVELLGDFVFVVNTVTVASFHSRSNQTFMYSFEHHPQFLSKCPSWVIADHGSEVFFVLGNILKSSETFGPVASTQDVEIAQLIMSYWVNFAKTGNPNGKGLEHWPQYNEATKQHLALKLPVEIGANLKSNRIDFWTRRVPELLATANPAAKY